MVDRILSALAAYAVWALIGFAILVGILGVLAAGNR